MMTIATIYGDWSEATDRAAEALSGSGIAFRVCLSNDSPGVPVLSMPFGDIRGLDGIREFAGRAAAQPDKVEAEFGRSAPAASRRAGRTP